MTVRDYWGVGLLAVVMAGWAWGQVDATAASAGVTGAHPLAQAYTMETTETTTQRFTDGLTMTHESVTRQARSADGRSRWENENNIETGKGLPEAQHLLERYRLKIDTVAVHDPQAGTSTQWNLGPGSAKQARISHMGQMLTPGQRPGTVPVEKEQNSGPLAQRVREQLGTRTMFGIEVTGSRTTTTFPPDFKGNSIGYKETDETWIAQGYGMFEQTTESPMGRTTRVVTAFAAGEPDASLFKPPADYTVVDEKR